ncbi:MAG: hypothetical protein KC425_17065 [Anaerolineales bacterium]|nr:hypothetical protein [Anaerolineales bacterium]
MKQRNHSLRSVPTPGFRFYRTLQVNILVAFAALLILTVLVIVSYTYRQNSAAILQLSRNLIAQVTETVIERTGNHLLPASVMAQASGQIPAVDTLALVDNADLESYGMEILRLYPQLAGFFIGNEQGEFLFTKRFPDGSIGTQVINRGVDPPVRTWTYRDTAGRVSSVETTTDFTYDPRQRPWYVGAKETQRPFWTDVYIFFTDQKPGITASYPVYDATGQLVSVIGIDIALDELSNFLQAQEVGQHGVVFILNDKSEVVAYPGVSLAAPDADTFRPVTLGDLGSAPLLAAYARHQAGAATPFAFEDQGTRYIASFTPFPEAFDQAWQIGIVVPENDFVGAIRRTNQVSLLISLAILFLAIVLAIFVSRSISRPIVLLTDDTRRISDLRLDGNLDVQSPIREVQTLADSISSMKHNLQVFKKYAPADLVRQLLEAGERGQPGGEQRELTVLFTQIGSFAGLMRTTLPEALMLQLSTYVGALSTAVSTRHGALGSYTGDGLLAFWGAPRRTHHAFHACRTALACLEEARALNQQWRAEGKITFPTRIGIHTGDMLVGNLGSAEHMSYTVVGENATLAKYLESLNDMYGSQIVVSEETYRQARLQFHFRPLDAVAIPNQPQPLAIFELLGERGKTPAARVALCERFGEGMAAYQARQWQTAVGIFQSLAYDYPQDAPTQLYLGRCLSLQAHPPDATWRPVTPLEFANQPRMVL